MLVAQLVADALVMAIWRRGRPVALLHRFDQASQYNSEPFQRLMADHGIACSMSRSGNVWDNAAMESFLSSLKVGRIRCRIDRTRDDARADPFDQIERLCNTTRRQSTIGQLCPVDFENQAMQAQPRVHGTGSSSLHLDCNQTATPSPGPRPRSISGASRGALSANCDSGC
jgi:putative transposase